MQQPALAAGWAWLAPQAPSYSTILGAGELLLDPTVCILGTPLQVCDITDFEQSDWLLLSNRAPTGLLCLSEGPLPATTLLTKVLVWL